MHPSGANCNLRLRRKGKAASEKGRMGKIECMTANEAGARAITDDRLFAGQLRLIQPARGHRAGTDAVLLASCLPQNASRIADLGASTGLVGLRAAQMNPHSTVTLIERDESLLPLAEANIAANSLAGRVTLCPQDVFRLGQAVELREHFDCVLTNPPFFEAGAIRVSPEPGKASAHVTEGTLEDWLRNATTILAPRGECILIHRADALEGILAACARRLGDIRLRFIHADAGKPAIRVLLAGRKGSRAPLLILPPVILNGPEGGFLPDIAALHRGEGRLQMKTGGETRPS